MALLGAVLAFTVVMGIAGMRVEVVQEFINVIPADDPDLQDFNAFREQFGLDGNAVIVGLRGPRLLHPQTLRDLDSLGRALGRDTRIARILTPANLPRLVWDDSSRTLGLEPIWQDTLPQDPARAEAIFREALLDQPFYRGTVYNDSLTLLLCAITIEDSTLSRKDKHPLIAHVAHSFDAFGARHQLSVHKTGLPMFRTFMSQGMQREMALFTLFALLFTAFSLYLFYRSFYAVVFPLLLLIVCTIVTFGIVGLLGYKISILMAMLPPIIVILGIPPSIYMLSEYHEEFVLTGDKHQAMRRMILKLGLVTLMINANTSLSFLTLYFTEVRTLQEFGLVAFLACTAAYFITIIMIPGIFSLLPPPDDRKLGHLQSPRIRQVVDAVLRAVQTRRLAIYGASALITIVAMVGVVRLYPVSYMSDDLPQNQPIYLDLKVLEAELGGAMPFEIVVDFGQPNALRRYDNLARLARLQDSLRQSVPELTRTVGLPDLLAWTRQAKLGGRPEAYQLPPSSELPGLLADGRSATQGGGGTIQLRSLVDSTWQRARLTGFVQDLGSLEMPKLLARAQAIADTVLNAPNPQTQAAPPNRIQTLLTGTTKIFLKANEYLIENLVYSLAAAFLIIALQMYLLFGSLRIMTISLIPNIIPLVFTAGVMGWFQIPLKPSTALIYEMAFGIAIDNSIHYLASYRHSRRSGLAIVPAVLTSLRSTGTAILYTSCVLFMGFVIFIPSMFGSIHAMGLLTAVTLFIATFSNLLLLPALLITFDRDHTAQGSAMIDDADGAVGDTQPQLATAGGI
jgi:predicted RND superfamily exporter protein